MRKLAKLLPAAKARGPPPGALEPLMEIDVAAEHDAARQCTVVEEEEGIWRLTGERLETEGTSRESGDEQTSVRTNSKRHMCTYLTDICPPPPFWSR